MTYRERPHATAQGDEGYLLIGLVVAIFLILLALSVAAPRVAKELERDREVESTHRAQEYVRAIQLFYRRTGSYPASIDVLLNSNNVKFLRQQYKDPLTNDDYRLIHVGEAQTQVKGFFGEPLQGTAQGNLGSLQGSQSSFGVGGNAPAVGAGSGTGGVGSATAPGGAAGGGFTLAPGIGGGAGPAQGAGGATGGATTGTTGSQSATTFQGSKGTIIGVGSNGKGNGLVEWNGTPEIDQWEFLYDPRVELLKAKVSLFGGAPVASTSPGLGTGFTPAAGMGGAGASSPGATTPTAGQTGLTK